MQHRVKFNDSRFLSSHSGLLCLSFEILQIVQDRFLGGLVPGTIEEDYLPTSDLPAAQDVHVQHVLDVGLDCRADPAYPSGDAVEAIDQPQIGRASCRERVSTWVVHE